MLLSDILSGNTNASNVPEPIKEAHFVEQHFVQLKLSWEEAAKAVQRAFPKQARVDRPAEWYRLLAHTHWPGRVLPGCGPYYIPEWVFDSEKLDDVEKKLKSEGFTKVEAHVVYLPMDREYLAEAMRVAKKRAWNVDPHMYRVYIYTNGKVKPGSLRTFNVYPLEEW